MHRLDRDTSGLLVVARSEEAYELLQELIRSRELERTYAALVRGKPQSASGRIEAPIGRDRRDRTRHSLDTPTPRESVTWFDVKETMRHHALLDVRLETGRTHQIRVHLEAIGLPVSGDPVYGVADDLGLERQFLHAHRLRFEHPVTKAEIDVSSELPRGSRGSARARPRLTACGQHVRYHWRARPTHVPLPGDQRLGRWCRGSAIGARFRPGPPEHDIRNHTERGWSRWQSSP